MIVIRAASPVYGSQQGTQPGIVITARRTIHSPWRTWRGGMITFVVLMLLVLPARYRYAAVHVPYASHEGGRGSATDDGHGGQNADRRCAAGSSSAGVPSWRGCQRTAVAWQAQP